MSQVGLLTKQLEEAKTTGLAAAEMYHAALADFGGVTSSLPADASAFTIFGWTRSNFVKLPEFVGGAMDFAALSCDTNLSKTLGKVGCTHVVSLKEREEFEGPSELGGSSHDVSKSIKNFMKHI